MDKFSRAAAHFKEFGLLYGAGFSAACAVFGGGYFVAKKLSETDMKLLTNEKKLLENKSETEKKLLENKLEAKDELRETEVCFVVVCFPHPL